MQHKLNTTRAQPTHNLELGKLCDDSYSESHDLSVIKEREEPRALKFKDPEFTYIEDDWLNDEQDFKDLTPRTHLAMRSIQRTAVDENDFPLSNKMLSIQGGEATSRGNPSDSSIANV